MKLLCLALVLAACGSVSGDKKPDANTTPDACVPETDTEFCARQLSGNACEMHSAMDNCGVARSADCGACAAGKGCVVGECKTPVCSTFTYTTTTLAAFSRTNIEDSIGTATPDGQVIVYIKSLGTASPCGGFTVTIADETAPGSGTYTQRDAQTVFTGHGLYTGQDGHTITANGLTIIARSADSKKWLATTRSAKNMIDFGAPSDTDFAAINATIGTGTFAAPVISADGLQFIYSIYSSDAAVQGIYSSVRTSTSVPFPAGTKMPPPVSDYQIATGLSSDRLTLFVFYAYQGRVLRRNSTSANFVNPNAPADPPMIPAWQHKPLADCSKLVAMTSPGGCQNEDVVVLTRQ